MTGPWSGCTRVRFDAAAVGHSDLAAERTFAWMTAHRRLARDYETDPARSETMIRWAMIGITVRRLTRGCPSKRPGPRRLRWTVP